jgi:tetratricopeptide (TPR) repeat protein
LDLLKKAEQLLIFEYQQNPNERIYRLVGITLNNLGCYYKRSQLSKVALKYLKKALHIEASTVKDQTNLAGTHLNICAILSYMKK